MKGGVLGLIIALIVILIGGFSWWWLTAGFGGGLFTEFCIRMGCGEELGATIESTADLLEGLNDLGDIGSGDSGGSGD